MPLHIIRGAGAACGRIRSSGRGAAWLARLLGVQEVPGSNPGGPTKLTLQNQHSGPFGIANLRFTNGELVTVSAIDAPGRIQLEDGRQLPADYRSFTHGYAVTAHRSQGKTVDSVIRMRITDEQRVMQAQFFTGRRQIDIVPRRTSRPASLRLYLNADRTRRAG